MPSKGQTHVETCEVVGSWPDAPAMAQRLVERLLATFCITVGGTVAGIWVNASITPLASPPGEAVMSWAPHMGHTMSEHEVFEG